MNIKWKTILLVVLINVATCSAFLALYRTHLNSDLEASIDRDIKNVRALAKAVEANLANRFQKRIASFVNVDKISGRTPLIQAFAEQNRRELLQRSIPYFNVLKAEFFYLSTMAWLTPDNINFLRVHNPKIFGDDIAGKRPDIVQTNREQKPVSGFMVAGTGLEYRLTQPVFLNNTFIGSVQFGIQDNMLLDAIRTQLNLPAGLGIPSARYQFITRPLKEYHDAGNYHFSFPEITDLDQEVNAIDWALSRQNITKDGKTFVLAKAIELVGFQQQEQAAIYVLLDSSSYYAKVRRSTIAILFFSGGAIFLAFGLVYISYSKLQTHVETLNTQLQRQNETLEEAVSLRTQDLQQSEDRFKKLSGVTFEGILIHDKGIVIDVNESLVTLFGYTREELIGRNAIELVFPRESHALIYEKFSKHIISPYELMVKKKDGTLFPVEIESRDFTEDNNHYRVSAVRDITERKKAEQDRLDLEAQLRQKYKMDSVGVMAGGMAHNFNNNLSIILGNIELSKMKMTANKQVDDYLNNAKIAVLRSRDLIQQIMTYSRQGLLEKAPTQLPLIVDETLLLLRSTIPTTINVNKSISSDSRNRTVNIDASQVQECLVNLCNNAMHAMEEKGNLSISLDTVELQQQDISAQYECQPGLFAKLSVQDDGSGMSAETVDKIFDLFYTTKPVDRGTGVGLSTVQGIVKQHGGLIKVHSTLGEGTTFELYFPVVEPSQREELSSKNEDQPEGTERILFIDDDEMLANLGKEILTGKGYQVTTMTESTEALKLFAANADSFQLVITDQTMPNLSGKDLIPKLRDIRPDIPTILCTGFSNKIDEETAKGLGINAFLIKPMDLPELLQTVRRVLDGKPD